MNTETEFRTALNALDWKKLKEEFFAQDQCLVIENFVPPAVLEGLVSSLPTLAPAVNRNYIPKHKKGGSVSRYDLDRLTPLFPEVYRTPVLWEFFKTITGQELLPCPATDPHTYALYYYTQPGDHIGWHYDTSYYRGQRFTVLFSLVNRSSCRLECDLYYGDPTRESKLLSLAMTPGTFVIFNGDKLWHRVTPMGENEERILLTMEFVTDPVMAPFKRFVSNMKDAIAYFGFRNVFGQRLPA